MSNVLDKIVSNKQRELVQRKLILPEKKLTAELTKSDRSMFEALNHSHADFILECKKASPSRGLIRQDFDLSEIVASYSKYASAISVLTDYKYFKGSFAYLSYVSQNVSQPVLAKDFFIDPYQVLEARYFGADAILLMLSVLDDEQYKLLATKANSLGLDILTEVHDQQELDRAIQLDARIIGINNRNLKDLSINLQTTSSLISGLTGAQKAGRIFISESGISTNQQIRQLSQDVNGFLIGSSIMASQNIEQRCKSLIYGETKICGISDMETAICAEKNGAIYAGFIFHQQSPRYISIEQAEIIRQSVNLKWVGVFVNYNIKQLVSTAQRLNLDVVQLHGDEDLDYIRQVRAFLPKTKIWKALAIKEKLTSEQFEYLESDLIDKVLVDTEFDGKSGGTGETFNWKCLSGLEKQHLVLAGGLNEKNILQALLQDCSCLDVNSGVEVQPGIKSCQKIENLFRTLRV